MSSRDVGRVYAFDRSVDNIETPCPKMSDEMFELNNEVRRPRTFKRSCAQRRRSAQDRQCTAAHDFDYLAEIPRLGNESIDL